MRNLLADGVSITQTSWDFTFPFPLQSLLSCTPHIPGITLWFWCSVSGTGCPGFQSLKAQKPQGIVPHLFPRQPWAGRNPWHLPSTSRCPHSLNTNLSKLLSAPRKSPFLSLQAATARTPEEGSAKPLPYLTNCSADFCRTSLRKYRIPMAFNHPTRKAQAHTLCWSCLMCPDCHHSSPKLPTLEGLFQPWRGLLWKELQESLWVLCMQTKRNTVELCTVKSTSWPWRTRAKVVHLLIIPQWMAKNAHEKAEKLTESTKSELQGGLWRFF